MENELSSYPRDEKRMQNFSSEMDKRIKTKKYKKPAIVLMNGSFFWRHHDDKKNNEEDKKKLNKQKTQDQITGINKFVMREKKGEIASGLMPIDEENSPVRKKTKNSEVNMQEDGADNFKMEKKNSI